MTTRPPETQAPETLAEGRFRLLEVIGEGGMATVYKAFDQRLQRPRAIKVLSPSLASRPSLRRRFLAEAQTMANLEESRVVRIFDTGEDGDRVYIVMELVDGGSLLDRVRDFGPLPPRMAAEATIQLCESLQAAHDAGVIHRDIKPHNILLTRTGEIRVTDFGIAQVTTEDGDGMTRTGAVMGTWGFMAPEQKTNAKQVDVRADVYSVGATLWSLLRAETPPELFMCDAEPAMLEGIPEELSEVIKRATRYRREDRYLTARDMAESLRALLTMLPEDPELTVPLVGHTLERPARPLDTMQQFASEVITGDGLHPSGTMVPSVGELPEPSAAPTVAEVPPSRPAEISPRDSAPQPPPKPAQPTPAAAPARSGLLVAAGGAFILFGLVVAIGIGAFLLWPSGEPTTPVADADPVVEPAAEPPKLPVEAPADAGTVGAAAGTPTPVSGTPETPPSTPPTKPTATASSGRDPTKKVPTPSSSEPAPAVAPEPTPTPTEPVVAAAEPVPDGAKKPTGLSHTPPGAAKPGESIAFAATLPDTGWTVTLYYRPASATAFDSKPMVSANGAYTTTVKATDAMGDGLVYFIKAVKGGTTLKEGSATSPRKVAIAP